MEETEANLDRTPEGGHVRRGTAYETEEPAAPRATRRTPLHVPEPEANELSTSTFPGICSPTPAYTLRVPNNFPSQHRKNTKGEMKSTDDWR